MNSKEPIDACGLKLRSAATIVAAALFWAGPVRGERLVYHEIRTDQSGKIVPWSGPPSQAYDHVIRLLWGFWNNLEKCENGLP